MKEVSVIDYPIVRVWVNGNPYVDGNLSVVDDYLMFLCDLRRQLENQSCSA